MGRVENVLDEMEDEVLHRPVDPCQAEDGNQDERRTYFFRLVFLNMN